MRGYVYQRGETWTFVVDVGRDPITGKRKQKSKGGFQRKRDAEAALRKLLSEIDENRYIEHSKEPFSSFIERWFHEHYKKRIKETTASSREYMLKKHLIDENPFANRPLSSITTEDIDSFYNLKLDEGYNTNYIRKMHQLLHQAFNQAVKWKKIAYNPAAEADPPSIKKEEMKIWALNELQKFLNECKNERNYITFVLAVYTGMRRGEILGLKWSDIDFDKKIIHVNRSLAYVPNKGYVLTTPKTKNAKRQIPISDHVIKELLIHKTNQEEWKQRLGTAYEDNNLVICTEMGTVQDPRNISRVMSRLCELSRVTPIRFHDIRHTHASILISSGVDIVKVSARLGHANPKITLEIYAHLLPNIQDDVAEIFENELNKHQ
jgi:integrase